MYRARAQLVIVMLVSVLSGCSEQDHWKEARPQTTPASGVVTYQDQPLDGAIVVFQPTTPGGIGASALTDADGKFELKTFPPDAGAVPGKYTVSIMKTTVPEQPAGAGSVADPAPVRAVSVIPEKYSIPAESGLVAEIPEEGTDTLDFDLKK